MKKLMYSLAATTLMSIAVIVVSCKDDNPTVYTVSFDATGGTPVPDAQKIQAGETAAEPSPKPAKQGYVFLFWHLSTATAAYSFQTPVNSDITLQAKWEEEAKVEYWQVTWQLNGGTFPANSNPATQVPKNGTLSEPNEPTRKDYTFEGWYKEAALITKTEFPYDVKNVTGNITLYAKWESEGGAATATYTIRNTGEWNSAVNAIKAGGNNKSYTLTIEGTVAVPPTTGVKQGTPSTYTFGDVENLTVTVKGSGTLSLSGAGFLMCLSGNSSEAKQKLIIDGPALQGRADNTVSLLLLDYADLELISGKITGNINRGSGGTGGGGGVYIRRGIFTMSGGEISNNTCGQEGYAGSSGGVYLSYSTFNMSGGTISGNTGERGGGVHISDYDFTMTGGVIKGNTARLALSYGISPYGGGVFVGGYGSFSKTGGVIHGSDADDADKNMVVSYDGTVYSNRGAAVLHALNDILPSKMRRETTLGEDDDISTGKDDGWGI